MFIQREGRIILGRMKYLLLLSSMLIFTNSLHIDIGVGTGSYCEMSPDKTTLRCDGILPGTIAESVSYVIITNYDGDEITSEMFANKNWKAVKEISLTSIARTHVLPRAFEKLKNLKCLGLHGQNIVIEKDSFAGIDMLDNLDLSGCSRIKMEELLSALNGSERIQQISTLNITELSLFTDSVKVDSVFAKVLGPKQITSLDLSSTTISAINLTAFTETMCDNLTFVSVTNCRFPKSVTHPFTGLCPSLKRINMDSSSFFTFPGEFPPNITLKFNLTKLNGFNGVSNIDTVSFNSVLTNGLPPIHNFTLQSLTRYTIGTESLSLTNNRVKYFDFKFINVTFALKYLDVSYNDLRYVQPKLFFESQITTINLSHNHLNEMAENNLTDFTDVFKYLKFLEHVNIASNKLTALSNSIFRFNKFLKYVDLSNNYLEQIGHWFTMNPVLVAINIRGNKISLLSSNSMTYLEQLSHVQREFNVDLRNNPLICNKCESKAFISWLVENYQLAVTDHECLGENNHGQIINKETVSKIEYICKRTLRIALITSSSIASVFILTSVVLTVLLYRKKKHKASRLSKILEQFREGRHKFKFVTFVAFSGEDEDFVEEFVIEPLRENLSKTTGTDRELICTGDRNFKAGHSIAEQMEECCRRSGVVILVVSKSFCASNHCGYEARIAFTMQKPIILLFKEHVSETSMTPLLRVIFRQFVRIMFKQDGTEFTMSTTWNNVCYSMLELITDHTG